MTKPPLQDIVMPSQRQKQTKTSAGIQPPQKPPRQPKTNEGGSGLGPKYRMWAIIVLVLAALTFLFSFLFSGVSVEVTPRSEEVFVDGSFVATKTGDGLMFEVMTLDSTQSKTVSATEKAEVKERSSGTIVIYNNFSSATQQLVKNTRFETPDGKIYRIQESLVVPGKNGDVPGSIEAVVYADETGESYNIGLTDFTIPGFKGSPQYEGFYARSKTPMTGGFEGTRLVVSQGTLAETRSELQETLKTELISLAQAQKPEGFIFYEDSISFAFESLPQVDKNQETEIRERGVLHAILFDEEEFARYLAESTLVDYDGNTVKIENPYDLIMVFRRPASGNLWEEDPITFDVNGTARIVWTFDEERLKADLAGQNKDSVESILAGYPGIDEADVFIRPFWKSSFPEDPQSITIKELTPTRQ